MKNIILLAFAFLTISLAQVSAQQKQITGKVIDALTGDALSNVLVQVKGQNVNVKSDSLGGYSIYAAKGEVLVFSLSGYVTEVVNVKNQVIINVALNSAVLESPEADELSEVVIEEAEALAKSIMIRGMSSTSHKRMASPSSFYPASVPVQDYNTEEYDAINENIFKGVQHSPLSTFSIDVDAASYSNVRRFINMGQQPPKDAVRVEELINYFNYDYDEPKSKDPFSINSEVSTAPWQKDHYLVHIGLQGKNIPTDDLPASNLVFLIDVSGSMSAPNKLPLLKSAFKMLVSKLRPEDKVSIVVYAGAAGVVLPATDGNEKQKIIEALDKLQAGGSTAGGQGIELAYKIAKEQFVKKGNNRVIIATDGDFNVGSSSNAEMQRLIESKRDDGIYLTVLGFGMGNYKDSKMEVLADKGNGNYAYIDNILEAKKVFINEFGGTLFTIAKDVKIQVEFNPAVVQAYRLIGYENRHLNNEDFNDDKKDAGELGAGHSVTALYEIIPVGVKSDFVPVDELKYQNKVNKVTSDKSEMLTVKLRYKRPDENESRLISTTIMNKVVDIDKTSNNYRWSASVAAFGMHLRQSKFLGNYSFAEMQQLAERSRGKDAEGYRTEFLNLMSAFNALKSD